MTEDIIILRTDILSDKAEYVIKDKIKRLNELESKLSDLVDLKNNLEKERDLLKSDIMALKGVVFDFKPTEIEFNEIKNNVNIVIKGLDNTKY